MIRDARAAGLNPTNRILKDFQPRQFVVCPMFAEDRIIGILGADRRDRTRSLTQNDAEDLQIFANSIAMVLERARIEKKGLDDLKLSYEGAVRALVKAIEVNDTYTRGHSERVAKISVKIAGYLGYDASRLDDLRFGCILHDVGKIGHASYLELQKKGPLTDEEYQKIKEHPVRGEEILKANEFFEENHRSHRAQSPRALGRQGVPGRPRRGADPPRSPDRRGRGCLRRHDLRQALQGEKVARTGGSGDHALHGNPFFPRSCPGIHAILPGTNNYGKI